MGRNRRLRKAAVWAVLVGAFGQVSLAGAGGPAGSGTCFGLRPTIIRSESGGTVEGTTHADVIVTGPGDDVIGGRGGNDRICSGGGDDRILGGPGSDRIDVGAGDDLVESGNGSDRVDGGQGRDTLTGERGNDVLFGDPGSHDFVNGGLGDDTVYGGAGDYDQLVGGVGNDKLHGGLGDGDVLRGDHGRDLFDGGSGAHDTASFAVSGFTGANSFSGTGVTVNLAEGRATQDGTDHLTGIEDVIGSPFRDTITGSAEPNVLYGAGGDDRLVAGIAGDVAYGGGGSDICEGFATDDSCGPEAGRGTSTVEADLAGGPAGTSLAVVVRLPQPRPGQDPGSEVQGTTIRVRFEGGAWLLREEPLLVVASDSCAALGPSEARCPVTGKPDAVLLDGSSGNDLIEVDASMPSYVSALIDGESGTDTLVGGAGGDDLTGAPAVSEHSTDTLYGRGGDDSLANAALLDGGDGSDLLIGAACGGQRIVGGTGVDSVSFARSSGDLGVDARLNGVAVYAPGSPAVQGKEAGCPSPAEESTRIDGSVERIEGSRWDDVLTGDAGPNTLLGRGGDDRLEGLGGGDILVGGTGSDRLFGGSGFDRLYTVDGLRDPLIDCGDPSQGVALVDAADSLLRHCARVRLR